MTDFWESYDSCYRRIGWLGYFAEIIGGNDIMTEGELQEKYNDRHYSYLYCGTESLMERLEDLLQYQYDAEAETAINDAIVYIRDHFHYGLYS